MKPIVRETQSSDSHIFLQENTSPTYQLSNGFQPIKPQNIFQTPKESEKNSKPNEQPDPLPISQQSRKSQTTPHPPLPISQQSHDSNLKRTPAPPKSFINSTELWPSRCGLLDLGFRIFGGSTAKLGAYPWMAAIIYTRTFMGSL